jgi:hypothetical protein
MTASLSLCRRFDLRQVLEKAIRKVIDFRFGITILYSYEAMTQGVQIGRLWRLSVTGHLTSKERNRS